MGQPRLYASTSAKVSLEDAGAVYEQAADFFKEQPIYLQYLRYYGKYRFENDLFFDLQKGYDREFTPKDFVQDRPGLPRIPIKEQ